MMLSASSLLLFSLNPFSLLHFYTLLVLRHQRAHLTLISVQSRLRRPFRYIAIALQPSVHMSHYCTIAHAWVLWKFYGNVVEPFWKFHGSKSEVD